MRNLDKFIDALKKLQISESERWRMAGGYTIHKTCAIVDESPAIEITDYEFNKIIKALEKMRMEK